MATSTDTLDIIIQTGLVAVVRLRDLSNAVELSCALLEGGVSVVEFTLTNRSAFDVIASIRAQLPEFDNGTAKIGAGSVMNLDSARTAIEAGSEFVVSPVTDVAVIDLCKDSDVVVVPGAYTPTEIQAAWAAGADMVKVFPARSLGPRFVRDILAPMPYLRLIPTGGVSLDNIEAYRESGAVAVGVGSALLSEQTVARRDWDTLTRTARQYAAVAKG